MTSFLSGSFGGVLGEIRPRQVRQRVKKCVAPKHWVIKAYVYLLRSSSKGHWIIHRSYFKRVASCRWAGVLLIPPNDTTKPKKTLLVYFLAGFGGIALLPIVSYGGEGYSVVHK